VLIGHTDYYLRLSAIACLAVSVLAASEYRGEVTFGGLPVPGATITAVKGDQRLVAITDLQGLYSFPDLTDGAWMVEIQMLGFAAVKQEVTLGQNATSSLTAAKWKLKLLPLDRIKAEIQAAVESAPPQAEEKQPEPKNQEPARMPSEEDLSQRAADGFLINGSSQNGAASPFAQPGAFGNNRNGAKGLYNGGIGIILDNSSLDAQQFSLTGQNTPKPAYDRLTGLAALSGPLRIAHLFKQAPYFFVAYQWTRNNNDTTQPGLMPTLAERNGVFSNTVLDPTTGAPFPGNLIPQSRISPQARALLDFYPLPNFNGDIGYNFQIPILSPTHQDALQSRFDKTLGARDQIYGRFAFQSLRSDTANLLGFLDTTSLLGINTSANWSHRLNQGWFLNLGYQFSRLATHVTPYFENRENVSAKRGFRATIKPPRTGVRQVSTSRAASRVCPMHRARSIAIRRAGCRIPCDGIAAPTTFLLGLISAGRNSITSRSRMRAGSSCSRAAPRAPISPTSCWAFRTPVPLPSATPTNISGNPSTTPSSMTIGGSVRNSPSTQVCAGSMALPSPSYMAAW